MNFDVPKVQAAKEIKIAPVITEDKEELVLDKETEAPVVAVDTEGCKDSYSLIVTVMIIMISSLVVLIASMGAYYVHLKNQKESKRAAEEANKDFDNIQNIEV